MATTEPGSRVTTVRGVDNDQSASGLLTTLASDVSELMRGEMHLAKAEMSQAVNDAKTGLASLVVGGVVLFAGVLTLLAALCFGLARYTGMSLGLSTLLVGLVVAVIGAILLKTATSKTLGTEPRPDPHARVAPQGQPTRGGENLVSTPTTPPTDVQANPRVTTHAERIDPDASPGTIEKQIDAKRADINRTLSALEERFSPGQMVDQALGLARDNGGELAQNLGRSFRDNPMPYVLTGIGLVWAMASSGSGGSSGGRYRSRYGYGSEYAGYDMDERDRELDRSRAYAAGGTDLQPRYSAGGYASTSGSFARFDQYDDDRDEDDGKSFMDKIRERAEAMGESLSDTIGDLSDEVSGMSDDAANRYREAKAEAAWRRVRAGDKARRNMETMRARGRELSYQGRRHASYAAGSASDFVQEQPMLAGALGAAVGALIGSLLPASELEDRYVGEHADAAKRQAKAQAESGMQTLREEAEPVVERMRTETEGGIKSAREKVEEAAGAAREKAEQHLDKADAKAREDEKSGPVPGVSTENADASGGQQRDGKRAVPG